MEKNFSAYSNPHSSESSSLANIGKSKTNKKGSLGKRSKVVKLSTDPQSVAARERRHRISDRFKILQSLVPGGTKMDTVSMLEEAINYVKFLKTQIWLHQQTTMMFNYVDGGDSSALTSSCRPAVEDDDLYYSGTNLVDDQVQASQTINSLMDTNWFQGDQAETMPFGGASMNC